MKNIILCIFMLGLSIHSFGQDDLKTKKKEEMVAQMDSVLHLSDKQKKLYVKYAEKELKLSEQFQTEPNDTSKLNKLFLDVKLSKNEFEAELVQAQQDSLLLFQLSKVKNEKTGKSSRVEYEAKIAKQ